MRSRPYLDILPAALLAVVASWVGSGLLHPEMLLWRSMDIWFDSDIPRIAQNMIVREEGHHSTFKHPLFPLLIWPLTKFVQLFTGDALTAIRTILALNAGLAVVLLMLLAKRLGAGRMDRVLVALVFIFSAAFMFWFTVPETFSFGATTILAALFAASYAAERRGGVLMMVIFGIAALSMTVTNFAVFCIALVAGIWVGYRPANLAGLIRPGIRPMLAVMIVGVVLAVIQDRLFGDAGLFFNVPALVGESRFVGQDHATPTLLRPMILIPGALLYGGAVTAQWVNVLRGKGTSDVVQLRMPQYEVHGALQLLGLLLFLVVILWGAWAVIRAVRAGRIANGALAILLATAGSLLFFLCLHMIYGAEVFLYVAHMLPLIAVLLAAGLMAANSHILRGCVAVLVILMALHNIPALVSAHEQAARLNFSATGTPGS